MCNMFLSVFQWWIWNHKWFSGWEAWMNEGDLKCPHHMLSQWIMKENLLSLSVEKLSQSVNTTLKPLFLFQKQLQKGCFTVNPQTISFLTETVRKQKKEHIFPPMFSTVTGENDAFWCKHFSVLNAISLSWLRIDLVSSSHPSCCYTL